MFRNKLSRFYLKECFQKTVVDEVGNSYFDHGVTSGQPEKEVEVIESLTVNLTGQHIEIAELCPQSHWTISSISHKYCHHCGPLYVHL